MTRRDEGRDDERLRKHSAPFFSLLLQLSSQSNIPKDQSKQTLAFPLLTLKVAEASFLAAAPLKKDSFLKEEREKSGRGRERDEGGEGRQRH